MTHQQGVYMPLTALFLVNNVMITRYITLLAGTSNFITMFVTRMQFFIEINK